MHELGMCEDVVHAVERRATGRPVDAVGVRVGALLRVVPDAFVQAFELVTAGSVADGAELTLTVVPATARCEACGATAETDDPFPVCAACASPQVAVSGGDELTLEWLRYADDVTTGAPAATDPAGAPPW